MTTLTGNRLNAVALCVQLLAANVCVFPCWASGNKSGRPNIGRRVHAASLHEV